VVTIVVMFPKICANDCGSCPGPENVSEFDAEDVFAPVLEVAFLQQSVAAGGEASFAFGNYIDKLSIYNIAIISKSSAVEPSMTLKAISLGDGIPSPANAGEIVYTVMSLSGSGIQSTFSTVNFKVLNSWIDENEIAPESVELKRLKVGSWETLDTRSVSGDESYHYYVSTFSGLSTFAIVGAVVKRDLIRELVTPNRIPTEQGTQPSPGVSNIDSELLALKEEPVISDKRFKFAFKQVFFIIAALAAVFLIFEGAVQLRKRHRAGSFSPVKDDNFVRSIPSRPLRYSQKHFQGLGSSRSHWRKSYSLRKHHNDCYHIFQGILPQ